MPTAAKRTTTARGMRDRFPLRKCRSTRARFLCPLMLGRSWEGWPAAYERRQMDGESSFWAPSAKHAAEIQKNWVRPALRGVKSSAHRRGVFTDACTNSPVCPFAFALDRVSWFESTSARSTRGRLRQVPRFFAIVLLYRRFPRRCHDRELEGTCRTLRRHEAGDRSVGKISLISPEGEALADQRGSPRRSSRPCTDQSPFSEGDEVSSHGCRDTPRASSGWAEFVNSRLQSRGQCRRLRRAFGRRGQLVDELEAASHSAAHAL